MAKHNSLLIKEMILPEEFVSCSITVLPVYRFVPSTIYPHQQICFSVILSEI